MVFDGSCLLLDKGFDAGFVFAHGLIKLVCLLLELNLGCFAWLRT